MYSSEFFYSHRWQKSHSEIQSFNITLEDIQVIQSLKCHRSDQSGYYDNMLQWRTKENPNINPGQLNRLYPAMQFIAMVAEIKHEFIIEYDVKNYEISLLRRLYLDWEYDDNCITMGFKRPFGNSHVLGDVREEMMRYGDQAASQRDADEVDDYSIEQEALNRFVGILEKFFQEGFEIKITAFKARNFSGKYGTDESIQEWKPFVSKNYKLHSYLYDWSPDISVIRDKKIKEILN